MKNAVTLEALHSEREWIVFSEENAPKTFKDQRGNTIPGPYVHLWSDEEWDEKGKFMKRLADRRVDFRPDLLQVIHTPTGEPTDSYAYSIKDILKILIS